jgi:hypothetical protein
MVEWIEGLPNDVKVHIGLGTVLIGAWIIGAILRHRIRGDGFAFFWFRPRQLVPFSNHWPLLLVAAVVYTAAILWFSLGSTYAVRPPEAAEVLRQIFEFPGIVFVFATGVLGVASVLNTLCLLQRNAMEVYSFGDLADSLIQMNEHRKKGGADRNVVYFVDYVPAVGSFSDTAAHLRITRILRGWASTGRSLVNYIFLAPRRLSGAETLCPSAMFQTQQCGPMEAQIESMILKSNLTSEADQNAKYNEMTQASDDANDELDKGYGAVWYTDRVNFEHYCADRRSAMAYYVLPDEGAQESRNQIRGSVLFDASHVRYLQEVCRTYLRQAITPSRARLERTDLNPCQLSIMFRVGQTRIASIELLLFDPTKRRVAETTTFKIDLSSPRDLLADTQYSVTLPEGTEPRWIKVKLTKHRGPQSFQTGDDGLSIVSPDSFFVAVE